MPRFSPLHLAHYLAVCVFVFAVPSVLSAQETQGQQVQTEQQRPPTPQEIELSRPTKLFFGVDFSVYKSQKLYGFGFYQAKWREAGDRFRPGIYGNILTTLENERPIFYDHLSVNSFTNHPIVERYPRVTMLNFGLTFATSHTLILYSGLGLGLERGRAELADSSGSLSGSGGNYSVPDPASDRTQANINLGAIVRIKRVGINFGVNSFTRAAHVGVLWGF